MGKLINLLNSIPKIKRKINSRFKNKDQKVKKIAKKFGYEYWDGPRKYGYGGYHYDKRWAPIAKKIVKIYELKKGDKVLDIGCGKGFLLFEIFKLNLGIEVFGLDISEYAIKKSPRELSGRIHLGNAKKLPFQDNSFDFVISLNTIHNLNKKDVIKSLNEINRVSKNKKKFLQVDSYNTVEEKKLFLKWVLTAKFHDYPKGWIKIFKETNYDGDYYWTIV